MIQLVSNSIDRKSKKKIFFAVYQEPDNSVYCIA